MYDADAADDDEDDKGEADDITLSLLPVALTCALVVCAPSPTTLSLCFLMR